MFGNENGKEWEKPYGSPMGWELVTKLGMGMGRNGNRLHGNGREWECKKPFPVISDTEKRIKYRKALFATIQQTQFKIR